MEGKILESFWAIFINYLPQILWAVFVFVAGWFVSIAIGRLMVAFFNKVRLNQLFKRVGWEEALAKFHLRPLPSQFFGEIVKWFFVTLFLMAATEIAGLPQFSQFLGRVIDYFLNVFIASLIFIVACVLVDLSQKIVVGTLEKEKITYSRFLGKGITWIIWAFAVLAILYQLQITSTLILAIFIGMVATISLALGIAFGLGGKEIAARILKELEDKFK